MRRPIAIAASIAALAAAGLSLALAQSGTVPPQQISQVTCGNLKGLSRAYRTALVYFAAGYQQGSSDAQAGVAANAGPSSASAETSAASSIEAPSAAPLGNASASTELGAVSVTDPSMSRMEASAASSASAALNPRTSSGDPIVGGLQLDAQAVLDAGAKTPDVRLSEVVAANGGMPVSGTATTTGNTGAGGGNIATSVQPSSAAASTAPSGEVSNDLNNVSQQLNNSVVSNQIEASAPPAGTTSITPGTTITTP